MTFWKEVIGCYWGFTDVLKSGNDLRDEASLYLDEIERVSCFRKTNMWNDVVRWAFSGSKLAAWSRLGCVGIPMPREDIA